MELFNFTLSFAQFLTLKKLYLISDQMLFDKTPCLLRSAALSTWKEKANCQKIFLPEENKWLEGFQTSRAVGYRVGMFLCHSITECFLSHSWRCALTQLKSIVCYQLRCWKIFLWGWNEAIHLCKSPITDARMKKEMECERLCTSHSVLISAVPCLHNYATVSFPSYFLSWQPNLHLAQWKHCSL